MGLDIASDLMEFGGFVIAHCAAIAASNEPGDLICPFAMVTTNGVREVIDFESETQQEAVAKGWASLDDLRNRVDLWAFGREGLYPDGLTKDDVLVVSLWKPGMAETISVLQRFSPTSRSGFRLFGVPVLLIEGKSANASVMEITMPWLMRGIARHPKGPMWIKWQGGDA